MRVEGKIVLVTGGGGGIGADTAALLRDEGATVIVSDLNVPAGGDQAAKVEHDVTSSADWARVTDQIVGTYGRLDVLVHCAGTEGSPARGLSTTEEDWNHVLSVNLTGTFLACKATFPIMLRQGTGSVILTSSVVSEMATAGAIAYGVSKAGVAHLARSFAAIGAQGDAKVRCNSVHPGSIVSRMSDSMFAGAAQMSGISVEDVEARVSSAIPFGARGRPRDIANLMLYLASDESAYVTGSQFKVDGGWSLKIVG